MTQVVLLVDDAMDTHLTVVAGLRRVQARLAHAYSGREAIHAALMHRPDVVILSVSLPDMTGFEVLRELRTDPCLRNTKIVFLISDHAAVGGARNTMFGADVVVTKPIHTEELHLKVEEVLAEKTKHDRLELRTGTDALTQLPLRGRMETAIDARIVNARKAGVLPVAAILDIRGFKTFCETRGHGTADGLLVAMSKHLMGRLPGEQVFRLKGDKFGLVLPDAALAVDLVEDVRHSTALLLARATSSVGLLGLNAGAAAWAGGMSSCALICAAEDALTRAKLGRNQSLVVSGWSRAHNGRPLSKRS